LVGAGGTQDRREMTTRRVGAAPACLESRGYVCGERVGAEVDYWFGGRWPSAHPPAVRCGVGFQNEGNGSHKESDKGKGACWVDLHDLGEAIGEAGQSEVLALEYGAC
jgi:hypothetical protein